MIAERQPSGDADGEHDGERFDHLDRARQEYAAETRNRSWVIVAGGNGLM